MNPEPIPDPDPLPPVVQYKRGSMRPTYQLTPEQKLTQFNEQGVTLTDADFTVNVGAGFTSASQKMDNIARQIAAETGTPFRAIVDPVDKSRADRIPFRGNPSDIDLINNNGRREAWVPLGGDLMTPGNEVVVMDVTNAAAPVRITTIPVGVRPQRLAVHPAKPNQLVFVCNQFSNYITVIDSVQKKVLLKGSEPVEVKTELNCTDLVFAPQNSFQPDPDKQTLYVANSFRRQVIGYDITLVRSGVGNTIADIVVGEPKVISGAGANPTRLSLGQDNKTLFVANSRGGELARIDLPSRGVRKVAFNGPTIDVIQSNDIVIVPTTTVDRGLPSNRENMPPQQFSPAVRVNVNGQQVTAHPGSQTDNTRAYNFEDLRNGVLVFDSQLNSGSVAQYLTDNVSVEPEFQAEQKILDTAIPAAVATNGIRSRIFVAGSGNDTIQEFRVAQGGFRLVDAPAPTIRTGKRPFALVFDEAANEILSVNWGGENIEIFDANTGVRKGQSDLGYGTVAYPATNMERGEYLFYNTSWSNNGRKSCGQCHLDELLLDGIPYANGATAASAYHKVPANFNLMTTDNYFWNGSFANGTYASLASDAQSRSNCELILFGLVEGITSNPNNRIGDPDNNFTAAATDVQCRPDLSQLVSGVLPRNFDQIAVLIEQAKGRRNTQIQQITANLGLGTLGFQDVSRFVDWYDVSELRLPPNPLQHLIDTQQLDAATVAKVNNGKNLFMTAGCGNCHNPNNLNSPFTDGRNHGSGSTWVGQFIDRYANDPRLRAFLPAGIPANMLQARRAASDDKEINVHASVDFFVPFCFDGTRCLQFDDPLTATPQSQLETNRLEAIIKINLANADRGFVPGNVVGRPTVNTPALRGLWIQTNYLRHGLARTLNETILAPGHPALKQNEKGFAMDRGNNKDVHGNTSGFTSDQVDDLFVYLSTL